ncbi:MAG TPA: hypothetical protein VGP05_18655 [Pseudonocardia sp.]|jgi:heme-degrading monooxygenase HmoA|nr:hypothetical protein [Pseudonocardia sp.]
MTVRPSCSVSAAPRCMLRTKLSGRCSGAAEAVSAGQPGILGHRLHRSVNPDTGFRFINVVWWESTERWAQAHDEGFRKLVGQPEGESFPYTPTLCEVVHHSGVVAPVI